MSIEISKQTGLVKRDGLMVGRIYPLSISSGYSKTWVVVDRAGTEVTRQQLYWIAAEKARQLPPLALQIGPLGQMATMALQRRDMATFYMHFYRRIIRDQIAAVKRNECNLSEAFGEAWATYRRAVRDARRYAKQYREQITADSAAHASLVIFARAMDVMLPV